MEDSDHLDTGPEWAAPGCAGSGAAPGPLLATLETAAPAQVQTRDTSDIMCGQYTPLQGQSLTWTCSPPGSTRWSWPRGRSWGARETQSPAGDSRQGSLLPGDPPLYTTWKQWPECFVSQISNKTYVCHFSCKLFAHLIVSMMRTSYIMMMILGRLLRMKITAIMIRTRDSLCSLLLRSRTCLIQSNSSQIQSFKMNKKGVGGAGTRQIFF